MENITPREVPKEVLERCERLWGDQVTFRWALGKQKFICIARNKQNEEYLLFVVQNDWNDYRPIGEVDFIRVGKARTESPQDELLKKKEMLDAIKLRRKNAQAEIKRQHQDKQEIAKDITKHLVSPAFVIPNNPLAKIKVKPTTKKKK